MSGISGLRMKQLALPLVITVNLLTPSLSLAADSLEALVNQGNIAAEKQDYPAAMAAYEQAVKKAPDQKALKNNLAVIYANHAVNLQEQKNYDAALHYLDKATALSTADSRESRNIQNARASVYFSQALDIKDSHDALTPELYTQIKGLLEKAISISPNELAFKKGMAGIYLDEAYQLAIQERYADACPLLEKALTYDPNNKNVKQSLANVYLGMARNEPANPKMWIEKALATDNSPKIQQVADKLTELGSKPAPTGPGGFAADPNEARSQAPKGLSQLSVADMIRDMENQLQLTPDKKATLSDRLDAIEKQVLGKTQSGAIAIRTKTVYSTLMGSYDGSVNQSNVHLVQAPVTDSENSYLDEIFKVTDGKVVRWGRFPIRVYFEEPKTETKESALYKTEYKAAALKGFEVWKERTDGFVKFLEVKNPLAADVIVNWTEPYVDRFADPDKAPDVYKTYTPPKRSHLMTAVQMASMFTPGYFSLLPQAAAAGLQYQQMRKMTVLQEESKVYLGLAPTRDLPPEAASLLIQNMAAKEFGHALGLKGSSPTQGDLLYPELKSDAPQYPTTRDLTTLRELYNRPPNIILNVR